MCAALNVAIFEDEITVHLFGSALQIAESANDYDLLVLYKAPVDARVPGI